MFLHLPKMREQREALRHSNKKLESTVFTVLYCISLICIHCIGKQYLSKKRLHNSVRMETVCLIVRGAVYMQKVAHSAV